MFTTLIITFLILGSVSMDSNLIELCSKRYFDSFVYKDTWATIQLSRKIDLSSYHLWTIWIREESKGYRGYNISYKLMEGQTPGSDLTQPEPCERKLVTVHYTTIIGAYTWIFKDLVISNDYMKGPQIKYIRTTIESEGEVRKYKEYREERTTTLYGSGILLTGLLCKVSDQSMYVIVEQIKSMNVWNRTQYVSELKIFIKSTLKTTIKQTIEKKITFYSYKFWLKSMDKTLFDFLGIDCTNITTIQSTVPTTSWYFVSTKTLFVMALVLFGSGFIFSVINLILVIKRRQPEPITQNTDMPSDVTSKPEETTNTSTSTSSSSSDQK